MPACHVANSASCCRCQQADLLGGDPDGPLSSANGLPPKGGPPNKWQGSAGRRLGCKGQRQARSLAPQGPHGGCSDQLLASQEGERCGRGFAGHLEDGPGSHVCQVLAHNEQAVREAQPRHALQGAFVPDLVPE